jgi:MFS family permease
LISTAIGDPTASSTTAPGEEEEEQHHESANQTLTTLRAALVAISLGILIFITATNMSLLTTTQSAIASDLDAFAATSWFTSSYLIPLSALGPLNGKLSAVFSPRLCISTAALALALGAVLCARAASFPAFLAGRVVAGAGASGVYAVGTIVVLELTGSRRRGLAIGLLNTGFTVGVAVGATAAGALLAAVGWRGVFWLQVPLCLAGGLGLLFALPASFHSGARGAADGGGGRPATAKSTTTTTWMRLRRLDHVGALTLTASLVLLLYAFAHPDGIPLLPILLSAVVAAAFVWNEVYLAWDPIIPLELMQSRGLLCSCLATTGFMMARWSVLFFAPTYALAVRAWSPSAAGAMLMPTNLGFAAGGLLVGGLHIHRRGSFYLPTLVTFLLFPVTLVLLAVGSTPATPAGIFIAVLFASGFITGAALNYGLAHLLHITPRESHYVATALLGTFRGFAGSFGSAIGGGMFQRALGANLTRGFARAHLDRGPLVRQLLGSPALVQTLRGVEREVAVDGYQGALRFLWLSMAVVAVVTLFIQAGTGWEGHEEKEKKKKKNRIEESSE